MPECMDPCHGQRIPKSHHRHSPLREIRPFLALDDSAQKVLVLARPVKAALDENGFLVIGAPEFLLRFLCEEY